MRRQRWPDLLAGCAAMTGSATARSSLHFGEFRFVPALRRLEGGGALVELSSRATDILAVLTERPGEVVSKRELLKRVWPDTVVVEAALRFHMVALRRALRDGAGATGSSQPFRAAVTVSSDRWNPHRSLSKQRRLRRARPSDSCPPVQRKSLAATPSWKTWYVSWRCSDLSRS
jgi:hypothetical protein